MNASSQDSLPADESLPPVAPDFVEQDFPEALDNIVPTCGYQMMPMVGLGGSAGSLQPLLDFLKAMPVDSGMAFVVILHLSPTHESSMPELLGRATTMPVRHAVDGEKVESNHVYVIPPGKYLAAVNGNFRLINLEIERGKRVAVDFFFRSLADTHGPHSAAIVLSGADGDGALGIKRIKERGGLTIAQDPAQAEHPGMPQAAIETGMVDWVLDAPDIPDRLLEYLNNEARLKLPPEDGPPPAEPRPTPPDDREAALREVLMSLRARTGRDFTYYKRATILRRIARRMQVNSVEDLPGYLAFLKTHPGEAGALLQDLLISVTNFFRDREVFQSLENYIPELFRNKTPSDTVRAWSPACATGEEAYSIAMLLQEYASQLEAPPTIQVFACDLDEDAIQKARAGMYPEVISADVSEERLRRFFVKEVKGYRVRRELREMVLFATHDLLKDAPFSRMDLISCRNLLIYLDPKAQQRAFDIFHFSLNPGGILLLGSSEAVEDGSSLFRVLDKKHRLYTSLPTARSGLPIPSGPSTLLRTMASHELAQAAPVVHGKHFVPDATALFQSRLGSRMDRSILTELHFKLIERYAPPSVLINKEHELIHLSENAGEFLRLAGGEPSTDILQLVLPALRIDLRTALFRAQETGKTVESADIPVEINGEACSVRISVSAASELEPGLWLVTFAKHATGSPPPDEAPPQTSEREYVAPHLERQLEQAKAILRDTIEQYDASTEELKASNEELQAMNEELRSATEELETSREELQSINEELTTVNHEMKSKMEELAGANSDLQNLMDSTSIATVFLSRALTITRFTPAAAEIFNIISSDVGRPLAHLKHRLEYPDLIANLEEVLRTLIPIEREVSDGEHWYLSRIQPYRTLEDQIAGTVLTLVDLTERKQAVEALRQSEERLRMIMESATEFAIFTTDVDRRVDTWNTGAEGLFGYGENEILGQLADVLFTPEDRAKGAPELEATLARDEGRALNERWHVRKDGSLFFGSGSVMPRRDKSGKLNGYVKIMRDLTERKQAEEAMQDQLEELSRFNAATVGREIRMSELKKEINDLCNRLGEPPHYSSPPPDSD